MTTHRHGDHWQALDEVVEATGAASLAHADDAAEIPVVTGTLREGDWSRSATARSRSSTWSATRPARSPCSTGDPGGIAHLWTGDCLFPGGVGNTHDDPTDFTSLMDDLEESCSPACPTTPGSTRATARTRPSELSGPTWQSGAPAAGDPARRGSRNRLDGLFRDLRGSH